MNILIKAILKFFVTNQLCTQAIYSLIRPPVQPTTPVFHKVRKLRKQHKTVNRIKQTFKILQQHFSKNIKEVVGLEKVNFQQNW